LLLNDKRKAMAKETPTVLLRQVYERGEKEYDAMIRDKALDSTLRYSKSRGQDSMTPSSLA
jgi:hypothetical protein